ncbi:glycosyltransferase family 1 protein [Bradyrhizobium sp. AZCC 1614]|uniref:glycosyltransferase family 1 protein n=1 Tax=Bradyrhizobium sp. AZCC 1614 TaxID=3117017 RepID=UPI003FA56277
MFQNSGLYPSYLAHLNQLAAKASSFAERRRIFLDDRFGALHFLKPVLEQEPEAFFTNGDDEILQRHWAREQGLPGKPTLEAILLAQIEHHRTEVFYNLDPVRYPSAFVGKLPGCVRKTFCWRAAPSGNADLTAYGAVLGNFPSILESWRQRGCRAELFFPALDPLMDEYGHGERTIDVLFVGGYSRHHTARAKTLEQVASLAGTRRIVYRLDASRLTRLAESPIGAWLPLQKHRRPDAIARIAEPPVFGRQFYELIGSSKIVLNGAIDMAGTDRGKHALLRGHGVRRTAGIRRRRLSGCNGTGSDDGDVRLGAGGNRSHFKVPARLAGIGRNGGAGKDPGCGDLQQGFAVETVWRSRRRGLAVLERLHSGRTGRLIGRR